MTADVQVLGARMLSATLLAAAADLADLSKPGRSAGEHIAQSAASKAPRRSGALASSLSVATSGGEVSVSSGLVYAGRTHYGWPAVRQAAQPFLTDALDQQTRQVTDDYMAEVDSAIGRVRGV